MKHLVLGGARSGKSTFAENLALEQLTLKKTDKPIIYIATATADDTEMSDRIQQHQSRREQQWQTVEEPIYLANALAKCPSESIILVDCLTLWLSNCLHKNNWELQKTKFLETIATLNSTIILVSNEVGSGIVPMGELSRQFVDESGWLHQRLAQQCTDVSLIVAGLASPLKRSSID